MKKQIEEAIKSTLVVDNKESIKHAVDKIMDLFSVSKCNLIKSILEDMAEKHPEYHYEVVEGYLDDDC